MSTNDQRLHAAFVCRWLAEVVDLSERVEQKLEDRRNSTKAMRAAEENRILPKGPDMSTAGGTLGFDLPVDTEPDSRDWSVAGRVWAR